MKKRDAAADSKGFTLIEVMITMFFMMFIIQGVAMVSLYSQRSGIYSRRLTSANIQAEQTIEKYRNTDYDNLPPFNANQACYDVHLKALANCAADGAFFTQTTSVTVDTPIANVTEVDVTVTWEQGFSWSDHHETGVQQAKLVSYISKF